MFAQRDLATLTGTVTDSSGAVVANARVVIIEQDTGQVYELTTNNAGEFTRPALKPSTYNIAVTATGFKKAEQNAITLNAGERTGVNITLTLGDVGQTVEVRPPHLCCRPKAHRSARHLTLRHSPTCLSAGSAILPTSRGFRPALFRLNPARAMPTTAASPPTAFAPMDRITSC